MIYNNNSERRCTMYYFHPILLPSSSMLIPNRSDLSMPSATASVGSRFVLFFDYYAHLFYYKLCIINYSFYLSHKIYSVFYV